MFLTYDEYLSMGGALSETEFIPLERRARAFVNLATHSRIRDESPVRACVKEAVYDLIGALASEAESAGYAGAGVSHKSNDGVSVTYASGASVSQYWASRKREVLVEHLADETVTVTHHGTEIAVPLLYGGVEYDGEKCEE